MLTQVTDGINIAIADTGNRIKPFDFHIYICPRPILKVTVMHMSTVNISQSVTEKSIITLANTEGRTRPFDWRIYIRSWPIVKAKIKVMNCLNGII